MAGAIVPARVGPSGSWRARISDPDEPPSSRNSALPVQRVEKIGTHRVSYPVLGLVLAVGCPLGLLFLRAFIAGSAHSLSWLRAELVQDWVTYTYLSCSTGAILTLLGWFVGRTEDALRATSTTDPLTGLWNRRYVQQRLAQEIHRARRHHLPLALLMVDVDGLKAINDRYGHDAGDAALEYVADALRHVARRIDIVGRFGGDEFLVVAPDTRGEAAMELAERIVARVGGSDPPRAISVSVGVADLFHVRSFDVEALFASADQALYEAKSTGKNRAVLAPLSLPESRRGERR